MSQRILLCIAVLAMIQVGDFVGLIVGETTAADNCPAAKPEVPTKQKTENEKDKAAAPTVPLPKFPEGAGEHDKEWPKEFQTSDTGLQYRILRKGKGPAPKEKQVVTVDYQGWFGEGEKGEVFASSYARKKPISFPLDKVILGWAEGMQHVGKGGMIELIVPPDLAYRSDPPPGIPKNTKLHFIVELRDVADIDKRPDVKKEFSPRE